jgi:hypothetical protein
MQAFEYPYTLVISYSSGLSFDRNVPDTKFKVGNKQFTFPIHVNPDTESRTRS